MGLWILDYIFNPLFVVAVSVMIGGWSGAGTGVNVAGATASLILILIYAYKKGYQDGYKRGRKRYFYVVYVAPITLGILGYLYGIWRVYGA